MRFKKMRWIYSICILGVFLICSQSIFADSSESLHHLKMKAKEFLENTIPVEKGETLSINIRTTEMPKELNCSKEIEISLPKEASIDKVSALEVVCNGDQAWHTFLPVQIDKFINVVVAKRVILTNETISENDLDFVKNNVNRLYSGFYKDKKDVVGQVVTHTVDVGGILTRKNTHYPQLVHRNQVIDLVARKNSIQVVMKGVAKSDGSLNDTITAYNPSSKRTLEAVVIGYNKAEVIS